MKANAALAAVAVGAVVANSSADAPYNRLPDSHQLLPRLLFSNGGSVMPVIIMPTADLLPEANYTAMDTLAASAKPVQHLVAPQPFADFAAMSSQIDLEG